MVDVLVSPCFLSLIAVCTFFHPHATHVCSDFLFLGGDGLAYGRMIHLIKQNPMLWLQKKPVVIPQLGEHPHTSHHIMHAGWRQWAPLLVKIAEIAGANSIVEDPDEVKHFNKHEFFLKSNYTQTPSTQTSSSASTHYFRLDIGGGRRRRYASTGWVLIKRTNFRQRPTQY